VESAGSSSEEAEDEEEDDQPPPLPPPRSESLLRKERETALFATIPHQLQSLVNGDGESFILGEFFLSENFFRDF
jgi:hypothetical protein